MFTLWVTKLKVRILAQLLVAPETWHTFHGIPSRSSVVFVTFLPYLSRPKPCKRKYEKLTSVYKNSSFACCWSHFWGREITCDGHRTKHFSLSLFFHLKIKMSSIVLGHNENSTWLFYFPLLRAQWYLGRTYDGRCCRISETRGRVNGFSE